MIATAQGQRGIVEAGQESGEPFTKIEHLFLGRG
jgi:hypothetical protein